jgi:uracil-DNA glycosylase family 4
MNIIPKPAACSECTLYKENPRGFIAPEGDGSSRLAVLGEAGGEHEHFDGLPFRPFAPAGSVLERAFTKCRKPREIHTIFNCANCRPPNDWMDGAPWEYEAISRCSIHRDRTMIERNPLAVLALGGTALRTMTGMSGEKQSITSLRGFVLPSQDYWLSPEGVVLPVPLERAPGGFERDIEWRPPTEDCIPLPTVGSFHPSFIRRGATQCYPVLYVDLLNAHQTVAEIKAGTFSYVEPEDMDYRKLSTREELQHFYLQCRQDPTVPIAYDIETKTSATKLEDEIEKGEAGGLIISIQFSIAIGTGVFLDWNAETIPWARAILALPNPKYNFNGYLFDDPVLLASGQDIKIAGERYDLMTAWGHLQPDFKGEVGLGNLQSCSSFYDMPFPWKHYNQSNPEIYGCADVDAPQRIGARIFDQMDKLGIRRGYEEHIRKLRAELEGAETRGIWVNTEKQKKVGEKLWEERARVFEAMQELYPPHLNRLHPPKGYKRLPDAAKAVICADEPPAKDPSWQGDDAIYELCARLNDMGPAPIPGDQKGRTGEWVVIEVEDLTPKKRPTKKNPNPPPQVPQLYSRIAIKKPFLPGSKDQILDYIKFRGYKVPTKFKTGDETTEKEELQRLSVKTKDPLFAQILEYRELDKAHSTYIVGWTPRPGRNTIHTTFTFVPATGQLSSRGPNAQNGMKHGALAEDWRDSLEAPPGRICVEIDYSAFHVLTTGFEASDKLYMDLARIDPHSFVASYFDDVKCDPIPSDLDLDEIAERTAWVKKHYKFQRNKQAKPGILGYGFGLGVNNFFNRNQENFENLAQAKWLFKLLDELFSVAAEWRNDIRKKAHRDGRLVSLHGYVRHFGEVYRPGKRGARLIPGNDSEAAIAFLPANDAFGHIKDAILAAGERGWNERWWFNNTVHDSIWMYPLIQEAEECIYSMTELMMEKSVILKSEMVPDGLWCGVEAEIGPSFGRMHGALVSNYKRELAWVLDKPIRELAA